jgi:hypothetical protein
VARALNSAGQPVSSAQISWRLVETVTVIPFQLDASGLVTGVAVGAAKVQAIAVQDADTLPSDPVTVTVTQ